VHRGLSTEIRSLVRMAASLRSETGDVQVGPSLVGATIHDYSVVRELGRGAVGVVYEAHDTKLIFLVRRDIVAQAVSHYLLRETGYAHSFNSEESRQSRSSVEYDAKQISRYLSLSQTAYQAWRTLLKDRAHCTVHYEQLTVDTVNEVRRLLTYIGFGQDLSDARIASCAGRTEKVGDRLNEEMIARFISEPECQATIAEARKLVS
jgi:LPS sulfotransferase NodH